MLTFTEEEPLRSDGCFTNDDLEIPSIKHEPLALGGVLIELVQASVMATSESDELAGPFSFAEILSVICSKADAIFCEIQSWTCVAGAGTAGMSGSELAKNGAAWLKVTTSDPLSPN